MWSTSEKGKRNNKGMTLVELLVAFAVSAIILAGLSYIIFSVLQFYGRANANVEIQNESQTSLNLVIDTILSAKGACYIEQDASTLDPATDDMTCALFGELKFDKNVKNMTFIGTAIYWQPKYREMYLMTGNYDLGAYTDEAKAPLEAIAAMKGQLPAYGDARLPYLMAQYVTAFELETLDSCIVKPSTKSEDEMTEAEKKRIGKNYFTNPLTIHVNMEFEYEYQNGKVTTRQMDDNVSVRNRLDSVYIQRNDGKGMIKYLRDLGL